MGQKINPVGIRIRNIRKWNYNWFLTSKNYTDFLLLNYEINKYLLGILRNNTIKSFLVNCYIGKISLDKLYIFVLFYRLRKKRKRISYQQKRKATYLRYNLEKIVFNQIKQQELLNKKNLKKNKMLPLTTKYLIKNKNKITKLSLIKLNSFFSMNLFKFNFTNDFIIKKKVKQYNYKEFNFINKNIGKYKTIDQLKKSLSELTNAKISLILINILSFMNFYQYLRSLHINYDLRLEATPYDSMRFENKMVSWFRYYVRFIKDVTHLTYITFFFKQPNFLAKFIGYQLYRTPKKFKHGKIIRFIIQLVKFIYSVRVEMTGLRIQFKGRINGNRRARRKQFINFGLLLLPTYQSYIEYGSAHGLTRYGVMGIKIWFCYYSYFDFIIQKIFLLYFKYSKLRKNKKNTFNPSFNNKLNKKLNYNNINLK